MAKIDPARTEALRALIKYSETEQTADFTLSDMDTYLTNERDRRFARQLVLGSIRWKMRLDWIIDKFSRQPRSRLRPTVENILRLGVFQIKFMERVPVRAAVDTSVQLAKQNGANYASGYINGLLRNLDRSKGNEAYPHSTKEPTNFLSVFYSHPPWLVEKWLERWGIELTTELLRANNEPSRTWLRRNPLRDVPLESKEENLIETGTDGYLFAKNVSKLLQSEDFVNGHYQVQDPAARFAVKLLDPQPGEHVLDLCSAPGGKTTQIAELMKNKGLVVATDISLERLKKVAENSQRLGLRIIQLLARDGTHPFEKKFDRVLLDTPCSGTGILGRHADARWRKKPKQVAIHCETQRKLLNSAFSSLRPGGILVYSTCSLEIEENEQIVETFAANTPMAEIEPARDYLSTSDQTSCYFQSIPGQQIGDGAFAARIRKRL
ncbi:MAG: 16S rRNA (cytosine(967)-C(5))-methyltransferase RsmB [Candidatus Latescibacterota bacterium]|nr:16S rRNA (cytosine(967)-C(5))-methyltransferase RsmB [Candidatus Latescibacterota bacterium]